MKIFLTEIEKEGRRYAGPNIFAETWELAQEAAQFNNLILVGEFVEIIADGDSMHYLEKHTKPKTLH